MAPHYVAPAGLRDHPASPALKARARIDFLGIGAQRSGTTWLFEMMRRHPAIHFPTEKEIHFWDQWRDRGLDWWLRIFANPRPGKIQGEITPAYAALDPATIAEIAALAPKIRLFMLLRNPIDRAWSAVRFRAKRAGMQMRECSEAFFRDMLAAQSTVARGRYDAAIANWLSVFPAAQLQILIYDEMRADPRAQLARLAAHLGVDAGPFRDLPESVVKAQIHSADPWPLTEGLYRLMRGQYEGEIRRLEGRLGRSLEGWLEPPRFAAPAPTGKPGAKNLSPARKSAAGPKKAKRKI